MSRPLRRQNPISILVSSTLDRAAAGVRVPGAAAHELVTAPLAGLCAAAAELRNLRPGRAITYSRSVFIPLTNVCRDRCSYCTFRRDPGEPGAHTVTPDEVRSVVAAARRLGCREVLFSLGDKPEAFPSFRYWLAESGYGTVVDYLVAMCRLVVAEFGLFPHANAGALGRSALRALRPVNLSMGLMLEQVTERLLVAGGPHHMAPDKRPDVRRKVLERAGELRIPWTTGLLIGIGETWSERVDTLLAIRAIQERYGHIQEVIVQNFRAKPGTAMAGHPEPDEAEMLRTVAMARLILGADMNIQAPPNLNAGALGRLLAAGINDWGGVSPLTIDFINPEAPWPGIPALRAETEAAGLALRERLPVYPEFLTPEFIAPDLLQRARAAVNGEGYVPDDGNQITPVADS